MIRNPLFAISLSLAASSALASVAEPAGLKQELRAPAGEEPDFVLQAQGAQIYVCKPREDAPSTYQWVFVAPAATLFENGKRVGDHGAGPTWEAGDDHSSVKGVVRARQDAGPGNIPWLLLAATPSGSGRFAGVTSIQRVATQGGAEPQVSCDAEHAGREARVKYTADYYFYKRRSY